MKSITLQTSSIFIYKRIKWVYSSFLINYMLNWVMCVLWWLTSDTTSLLYIAVPKDMIILKFFLLCLGKVLELIWLFLSRKIENYGDIMNIIPKLSTNTAIISPLECANKSLKEHFKPTMKISHRIIISLLTELLLIIIL